VPLEQLALHELGGEVRAAEAATAVRGDDGRMIIPTKLFVGGLSSAVTDAALKELFSQFGNVVEARVQIDKFTRLSRNFGFIVSDKQAHNCRHRVEPLNCHRRCVWGSN